LEDYDGSQPRVSALVAAEEADRNVVHASDLSHYVSNPTNWPANTAKIMAFANATYFVPTDENILQGSDMTLTGNAIINGNLTVGGDVNISGATTLTELTVTGSVQIQGDLQVVGSLSVHNIVVGGHIITAGTAPQVYVGLGAGMDAEVLAVEGNDTSGTITILAGTNTTADELARLEFSQSFASKPRVTLTPANREATQIGLYYEAASATQNDFRIMSGNAPEPGKTYVLTYFIVE
jgi:cytoskeletal protein CcmA (bactofilin family)